MRRDVGRRLLHPGAYVLESGCRQLAWGWGMAGSQLEVHSVVPPGREEEQQVVVRWDELAYVEHLVD